MHKVALQGSAVPPVLQDLHEPTCTPRCLGLQVGSAAQRREVQHLDHQSWHKTRPAAADTHLCCRVFAALEDPVVLHILWWLPDIVVHNVAIFPTTAPPAVSQPAGCWLNGCLVWAMAEVMAMWEHNISLCTQNICYLWPCCVSAVSWLAMLLRTADLELHTAVLQRPHCDSHYVTLCKLHRAAAESAPVEAVRLARDEGQLVSSEGMAVHDMGADTPSSQLAQSDLHGSKSWCPGTELRIEQQVSAERCRTNLLWQSEICSVIPAASSDTWVHRTKSSECAGLPAQSMTVLLAWPSAAQVTIRSLLPARNLAWKTLSW